MLVMLGLGMLARHIRIIPEKAEQVLSGLIVKICLPALILDNILSNYTWETLKVSLSSFFVPFVAMVAGFLLSLGVSRLMKVPAGKRGRFHTMFFLSNSIFVGLPVVRAIFGEEAVSLGLLYYLANTVLFWTVGYSQISGDGDIQQGRPRQRFSASSLKKLFSPPLVALGGSILLMIAGFTPPAFLMNAAKYMGSAVTPLSMLFIGVALYSVFRQGFRWDRSFWGILLGRVVLLPLLTYAVGRLFGVGLLPLAVFVIQAAMPVMTQVSILSNMAGADEDYPASATLLTTLAGFACIPLYTVWISSWGL